MTSKNYVCFIKIISYGETMISAGNPEQKLGNKIPKESNRNGRIDVSFICTHAFIYLHIYTKICAYICISSTLYIYVYYPTTLTLL